MLAAMRLTTVIKWTAMGSFAVVIVMWVGSMFAPHVFMGLQPLAGGALMATGFALAALACASTLEQGRSIALMWSGIVTSTLATAGWIAFGFRQPRMTPAAEELWVSLLVPLTCWVGLCAIIGLVRQRRQPIAVGVWVGRATIAGAALLAAAIPLAVSFDLGRWEDDVVRGLGALSVVVVLGLVAAMVIARLRQLEGVEEQEHVRLDFTAVCPRCELRQPMVTGGDVCRHCGLNIRVIVP
jgi:hypothetical protein